MAEARPFAPVKIVCGLISGREDFFREAEERLQTLYGPVDARSPAFDFDLTDYYQKQMGQHLKRLFLGFERLTDPASLSEIKLRTNELEDEIRARAGEDFRVINIDPGILTSSALIMATAKDFSHRIPLQRGVYGHLELLFTKKSAKPLDWTYPDFRRDGYQVFFLEIRSRYLEQLRRRSAGNPTGA